MTSRKHKPGVKAMPDAEVPAPDAGLDTDAALREAIARLMLDDAETTPLTDDQRRSRVESLRRKIESGQYMSEGKIEDVVDRLMRKWKL